MGKQELIDMVKTALKGRDAKLSAEQVTAAVEETLAQIAIAIRAGQPVQLRGFGTFQHTERAARTGRNPKTGEAIALPAKAGVKFKAAKELTQ